MINQLILIIKQLQVLIAGLTILVSGLSGVGGVNAPTPMLGATMLGAISPPVATTTITQPLSYYDVFRGNDGKIFKATSTKEDYLELSKKNPVNPKQPKAVWLYSYQGYWDSK